MDTSTSKPSRITSRSRTSSREVADDVDSLSLRKRSRADGGVGVPVTCSLVEKPLLDTRDPALASLTLRCGVNNQYLLEDAVRGVIGAPSLLRVYGLYILYVSHEQSTMQMLLCFILHSRACLLSPC